MAGGTGFCMVSGERTDAGSNGPDVLVSDVSMSHGLDRGIQGRIGEQLRAMYDGLMEQPVPDRFHSLLARLEAEGGLGDEA